MEFDQIRFMEHLALDCRLSLHNFCEAMQRRFELPTFEFDAENETAWGLVEHKGIEYNVSRPYKRGTLHEWDDSVPEDCNFGVILMVSRECPPSQNPDWSLADLVPNISQGLANLFRCRVYHHRTRINGSSDVLRTGIFEPSTERV